jgi:metal-responsive CopG/Arc/MetJ family transcriptional regulator
MNTKEKVRLSLDLSKDLYDQLESLATDSHASKSDVLRKALGLMIVAADAKKDNKKLGVFNKDEHLEKEIVGI